MRGKGIAFRPLAKKLSGFDARRGSKPLTPVPTRTYPSRPVLIPKLPLAALLALVSTAAFAVVEITEAPGKVTVKIGGQPFTEYVYEGAPHTYFHPVLGPGGVRMTRAYPMERIETEDTDHPHHRSIWFAHGKVNGVDYWSEQSTFGTKPPKIPVGKILHDKFLEVKGGEKSGVIRSTHRWEAPDGTIPLTDTQTVTFHDGPDTARVLDFETTLKAGEQEVVLGETKEGTMGVRVAESMRLKPNKAKLGTGHLVSSEGQKDGEVWGKKAKWVDYHGPVDGKQVGIAIFDHPSNPRHPTRWHARDYGLFAANPFCEYDMDKTQPKGAGDYKLAPGQSVTLKYRIYIHEGDAEQAKVAERYAEYAK